MGTDTICRGTFWVQTQNLGTKRKTLKPLKCLASPDHTFLNVCKFPLCSYKEFGVNSKFWCFKRKMSPKKLKNKVGF